jgi:threonine synthase
VLVSDEAILDAEATLGHTEGIYAEPAAATPVAGVRKALEEGIIEADETVVVNSTGFGLKDSESAKRAAGSAEQIEPDISEVERLYGGPEKVTGD